MKASNILITGGAGLVGSHLCDALIKEGYSITCIDNFITGRRENIVHLINNPKFNFLKADASQPPETYLANSNLQAIIYNYIFHLASPASPKGYMDHPITTYKVNSFGTHHLLKFARKHKARFLFASTSEVYGDPEIHPQPETYWGNVNPNGVRACYDESKRFGEMACKTFARKFKLDVRIVRIFNTYGPRNDPFDGRVIPNFINQALKKEPITVYGDGRQTRSFCYVSDLVKGIMIFMFKNDLKGEVINLGSPEEFKVLTLAQKVKKLTKSSSKITFTQKPEDDPSRRKPDISKAKKLLNWEPETNLDKGLLPTIAYFKELLRSPNITPA